MKKLLFIAVLAIFGMFNAQAQDAKFGAKVGYTNITAKADFGEESVSVSESGFYVGALVDFTVNESFHVQPEINYANVEETNFLYIPVLAKYYISNLVFN
jgi:opacity protein-like surface antigen